MCVGSRTGPDRTMVSEELLFEMYPMNSTDMIWLQFGEGLQAEREPAGGDSGGVVLRGMNAPAQGVAIVPLQRIGSRQAMIAGQRKRVLDHGDGVVRHRHLDDAGLGGAERQIF